MDLFSSTLVSLIFASIGHFQKGVATPPLSCRKDWEHSNGSCYKFITEKALWHEAELQCLDYSKTGHLVSIHDKQEAVVVEGLIKARQNHHKDVWIGLYSDHLEGLWWWTDDSKYGFAVWAPGEPQYQGSHKVYCVQLSPITGLWKWEATSCHVAKEYICKYQP